MSIIKVDCDANNIVNCVHGTVSDTSQTVVSGLPFKPSRIFLSARSTSYSGAAESAIYDENVSTTNIV